MKANEMKPKLRVVLGATCYVDAEATMHLSIQLARLVGAEIHGVLVNDGTVFSAARASSTRTVTFSGETSVNVTVEAISSAFRSDARMFEQRLKIRADKATLNSGFSTQDGKLFPALEHLSKPGDYAVLGFRRAIYDGDCLFVALGENENFDNHLKLAVQLSTRLAKPIIISASPSFHGAIKGWFSQTITPLPAMVSYTGTSGLLSQLETLSPVAVLMATGQHYRAPLAQIIDAARCPVIVPT